MIAEFRTAGGDAVPLPAGASLAVTWFDAEAQGGHKMAEMTLTGPTSALWQPLRWLGYRVTIRDNNGNPIWHGILHDVTVATGSVEIGLSLENMFNRIAVAYTEEGSSGSLERQTTSWAENADSINRYGYKELLYSLSDVNQEQAEAQRATLLATFGNPQPMLRISPVELPITTMACVGLYNTLDWRYYEQLAGKEEHTDGGAAQPLGQGVTGTNIGFTSDGRIHDFGNRLDELTADHNVEITGSTSNNGTHLIDSRGSDGESYTSTNIYFDATDDVHDVSSGMAFLSADDIITISGSVSNDGTMRVKTAGADHLTVTQTISSEITGASVTITQAGSILTSSVFTNELPSATTTITVHGQKIAQSFSLAVDTTWTVDNIAISVRRQGSPADNLQVDLCSDSAGSPGSVLASDTVAGSTLTENMAWVEFDMGNTQSVAYGTTYWIVVSRTGSNDIDDYYLVDTDEAIGYSRGSFKVYTGSAWTTRHIDADMAFRVRGAVETTTQINSIYTAVGQFFTGIDLVNASGIYSNQYREGDTTGKSEIDALLSSGTSAGVRLLAATTVDGVLKIYAQPSAGEDDLMLRNNGRISWQSGSYINDGWLPVGKWLKIGDIPPNVDVLSSLASIFIERAEFRDGALRVEPQGMPSPWDVSNV